MSEPIKVGDLIMVIRECCDQLGLVGKVREATAIEQNRTRCCYCGQVNDGVHVFGHTSSNGVPVSWVKRIPPLSELEGEKRDEKLTEPA